MSTETVQNPDATYPAITPYMHVDGAAKLIVFLKQVFGAIERGRQMRNETNVMHAELKIGDSLLMLCDPMDGYPANQTNLYLFLNDCDSYYQKALAVGATSIEEPADQPYGHRRAGVMDVFGNSWYIAAAVK